MKSTVVWNLLQLVGPSKSVLVYTIHSLEKQQLGLTRYTGVASNIVLYLVQLDCIAVQIDIKLQVSMFGDIALQIEIEFLVSNVLLYDEYF